MPNHDRVVKAPFEVNNTHAGEHYRAVAEPDPLYYRTHYIITLYVNGQPVSRRIQRGRLNAIRLAKTMAQLKDSPRPAGRLNAGRPPQPPHACTHASKQATDHSYHREQKIGRAIPPFTVG